MKNTHLDKTTTKNILKSALLDTPLGTMIAIGNEESLYLLEFIERCGLDREIELLQLKNKMTIIQGRTKIIDSIEDELTLYFKGELRTFQTPFTLIGTPFQRCVWEELAKIPFGETRSYGELAASIGRPTAFRAVAQANSTNQLAILIPCHRVINMNGALGGYAGGIERKKSLLTHENLKMAVQYGL